MGVRKQSRAGGMKGTLSSSLKVVVVLLLIPGSLALVANWRIAQEGEGQGNIHVAEPTWNLGIRASGPVYKHTFSLLNHLDRPIKLLQANSSCGCTVPELPSEPIPPGAGGKVHVTLDSAHRTGKYHGLVAITTDNAAFPQFELKIVGEFKNTDEKVSVFPEALHLESVLGGEDAAERIMLQRIGSGPLGFESVTCDIPGVIVEQAADIDFGQRDPARYTELLVRTDGNLAVGKHEGTITVKTNHAENPPREIPIVVSILSRIEVYPSEMIVLRAAHNDLLAGKVLLRDRLNGEVAVTAAKSPSILPGEITYHQVDRSTVEIRFTTSTEAVSASTIRDSIEISIRGIAEHISIPLVAAL